MKTFIQVFIAVFLSLALIFIGALLILGALLPSGPSIPGKAILELDLQGDIPEYVAPDPLQEAFNHGVLDIHKIRDDLEKAFVDKRIKGIIVRPELLNVGFGKLQELHALLKSFREHSEKPIYAYLGSDISFTRDYYLACACDSIIMPADANLFLTGVRSEVTFYKDFFNKIGVEAQFLHIGKYKNAPDAYTRNNMSPWQREVLQEIIDQYYNNIVRTIARNRHLSPEKVDELINQKTGFSGAQAKDLGLVDRNAFYSEVEKMILARSGAKSLKRLSAIDYASVPASSLKIRNKSRIAVINCEGTIYGGSDSENPAFGRMLGAKTAIRNIRKAAKSRLIKAIILRIDSPGGASLPSSEIWQAIMEAKKKKPVIASVGDLGASGGYLIAIAADTIIALPNSLVGSVGVFAGKFNFNGTYDKLGLNVQAVQKGKHADIFSTNKPWDKEEKAIIQEMIWEFYHGFVSKVARARGMSYKQVDRLAQGRVWTGLAAFKNGLIDTLGNFYTAVKIAKKKAGIPLSESVRLVYYPRKKSLMNELLNTFDVRMKQSDGWLKRAAHQLISVLESWQNKPLALLPFKIAFK